jgi:hypothetical protein
MDHLELVDGTRHYYDLLTTRAALYCEGVQRCLRDPDSPPAEIRKYLAKATPDSLRRFEERVGPVVRESAIIYTAEHVFVRRIEADGEMTEHDLRGEEARAYLEDWRAGGCPPG